MKRLTEKQERVYEFLVEFIKSHGYPPTVREIGEYFGFLWSAARGHLRALERKGLLRINPLKSRGIEIKGLEHTAGFMVPVAGKVRAGKPILATEEIETRLLIDKSLFPARDAFALKITGDSMVDAGIWEGDYVIVKPRSDVGNGEIGVVLIEDEATVKRIYLRKGEITLKPENKSMEPVTYKSNEVQIIGKVIGVVRKI
jgi:repressor LexA